MNGKKKGFAKFLLPVVVVLVIIVVGLIAWNKNTGTKRMDTQVASVISIPTPPPTSCVGTTPSINVTSPDGGQTYYAGQTIPVTWTTCNISARAMVKIYVSWPRSWTLPPGFGIISAPIPNTGSTTIVVPNTSFFIGTGFSYGNYYKVNVSYFDPSTSALVASGESHQTFTINPAAINITQSGTPTIAVAVAMGGAHDVVHYAIPFSVTALGQAVYIPSHIMSATTPSATNKVQFCIDTSRLTCQTIPDIGSVTYTGNNSVAPTVNGNYMIPAGQTMPFLLSAMYTPTAAVSTRAGLLNVNWAHTDLAGTTGWSVFTTGLNTNLFKTPYASAQ